MRWKKFLMCSKPRNVPSVCARDTVIKSAPTERKIKTTAQELPNRRYLCPELENEPSSPKEQQYQNLAAGTQRHIVLI